jgi:hypothetical protein
VCFAHPATPWIDKAIGLDSLAKPEKSSTLWQSTTSAFSMPEFSSCNSNAWPMPGADA